MPIISNQLEMTFFFSYQGFRNDSSKVLDATTKLSKKSLVINMKNKDWIFIVWLSSFLNLDLVITHNLQSSVQFFL